MFDELDYALNNLPRWLRPNFHNQWHSMLIDYHPPIVERLWMNIASWRVLLHRIHPCKPEEALLHPHPWPSAVRILSGRYEMGIAHGEHLIPSMILTKLVLTAGTSYEMAHRNSWHYVRPLDEPSLSIMVIGTPWERPMPIEPPEKLGPLSPRQRRALFDDVHNVVG